MKNRDTNKKNKEKKNRIFTSATVIFLLSLVILVLVSLPFLFYYHSRMEARQILKEAKNIELSINLTSTEYYGQGRTIKDSKSSSGLRGEAEEQVRDLAHAYGELNITEWDSTGLDPVSFIYREGNYLVQYEQQEGKDRWKVSRLRVILNYFD